MYLYPADKQSIGRSVKTYRNKFCERRFVKKKTPVKTGEEEEPGFFAATNSSPDPAPCDFFIDLKL